MRREKDSKKGEGLWEGGRITGVGQKEWEELREGVKGEVTKSKGRSKRKRRDYGNFETRISIVRVINMEWTTPSKFGIETNPKR